MADEVNINITFKRFNKNRLDDFPKERVYLYGKNIGLVQGYLNHNAVQDCEPVGTKFTDYDAEDSYYSVNYDLEDVEWYAEIPNIAEKIKRFSKTP